MNKLLDHPASKTFSGQPKPLVNEAKLATPKRHPATPSLSADSLADDSKPPAGLFGATELAINDIEMETERLADSEETLPELEREIGIADWIDPQTGEPAEGQSPPHLEDD